MSRGRPISLSDRQLAVVFAAARSLRPGHERARFLSAVADRLEPKEPIVDCDVEQAVEMALERLSPPAA